MAACKRHVYGQKRNSWWFLLKDSVIFVLIMCILQVLHVHLLPKIMVIANTTLQKSQTNHHKMDMHMELAAAAAATAATMSNDTEQKFLIETKDTRIQQTNQNTNNMQQEKTVPNVSFIDNNQNNQNNNNNNNNVRNNNNSKNNTSSESSSSSSRNSIRNSNNSVSSINLIASKWNLAQTLSQESQIPDNTSATTTTNKTKNSNGTIFKEFVSQDKENLIREKFVLPTLDSEREAQLLYEQTLKDYHGEAATSIKTPNINNSIKQPAEQQQQQHPNTIQSVCDFWTLKHCQCTGTVERLLLSCRSIGILAVPIELSNAVVQL